MNELTRESLGAVHTYKYIYSKNICTIAGKKDILQIK